MQLAGIECSKSSSQLQPSSRPRTVCSSSAKLLTVTRHNLSLGSRACRISAPTTWRLELAPTNVRDCSSLASFWNHLKTHYFSSAFSALWHLIHMRLDSDLTIRRFINHLLTYLLSAKPKDISDGRKITAVASQHRCDIAWALFINVLIIIITRHSLV